ncbi:GNAT family N-acetyltransferase [Muricoccus radiodurans]|uniref:GNAT family N-acetyltransferase n=1 Tax=Muricoccus radiodurans TaxID=2231721 RepID=UPI003CF5FAC2
MPGILLRPMEMADLPAVCALHDLAFASSSYDPAQAAAHASLVAAPDYADDLRSSDLWLAVRDGRVLGSAGWLSQPDGAARIRKVFVHPDAARQGLATRLVQAAERRASAKGHARFVLRAYRDAVPLYERLGYAADRAGEMPLPGGVALPVLFMRKDRAGH